MTGLKAPHLEVYTSLSGVEGKEVHRLILLIHTPQAFTFVEGDRTCVPPDAFFSCSICPQRCWQDCSSECHITTYTAGLGEGIKSGEPCVYLSIPLST